jgi:hypothetical protein
MPAKQKAQRALPAREELGLLIGRKSAVAESDSARTRLMPPCDQEGQDNSNSDRKLTDSQTNITLCLDIYIYRPLYVVCRYL